MLAWTDHNLRMRPWINNSSGGWLIGILVVSLVFSVSYGDGGPVAESVAEKTVAQIVQQKCPVIPDNDIDPEIFTEYQGKRVYFCCNFCMATFLKDPEKYLPILGHLGLGEDEGQSQPGSALDHHQHSDGGSPALSLAKAIEPMGVLTLTLLMVTVLLGVFRRKMPKRLLKWHKRCGITTLVVALLHALLVLIAH